MQQQDKSKWDRVRAHDHKLRIFTSRILNVDILCFTIIDLFWFSQNLIQIGLWYRIINLLPSVYYPKQNITLSKFDLCKFTVYGHVPRCPEEKASSVG